MSHSVLTVITLPTPAFEKKNKNEKINDQGESRSPDRLKPPACDKTDEKSLKQSLQETLNHLQLDSANWMTSKDENFYHVSFVCDVEESDSIIQFMHDKGFGSLPDTFVGIIPFAFAYQGNEDWQSEYSDFDEKDGNESGTEQVVSGRKPGGFKSMQEKFLKSVTARLTVAQVVSNVESGSELTFDFLCYVLFAAWMSAMGLLEDSVVTLVASMLVSPLMGPIMAITFGTIVRDRKLRNKGIRAALVGFSLGIIFGYLYGLIVLNFTTQWNPLSTWPTKEMQSRGELRVLWVGALVALPSGAAVAVSILSGNQASLVGVAISASLLPPCVNRGLLWAFATLRSRESMLAELNSPKKVNDTEITVGNVYVELYSSNISVECFYLGLISFGLALINVICIFIMSWILLKVKEVTPLTSMSAPTSRFWKEDVKIARDYNRSVQSNDDFGTEIIKEWAEMNGLDANQLLNDKPESRIAQLQTLNDIMRDIEEDSVFQKIVKNQETPVNVIRRMSCVSGPQIVEPPGDIESGLELGPMKRRASTLAFAGNQRMNRVIQPMSSQPVASAARRQSMIDQESIVRNLRLVDSQRMTANRRSSVMLQKALQRSDHSAHSLWPGGGPRKPPEVRFNTIPVSDTSRKPSRVTIHSTHLEESEEEEDKEP